MKFKKEKYTLKNKLNAIWTAIFGKEPVVMTYKQLKKLDDTIKNQQGRIENLNKQLMRYMDKEMTRYFRHY